MISNALDSADPDGLFLGTPFGIISTIVSATLDRILRLLSPSRPRAGRVLDGFVDSLLQTFENCRAGLSDETLRAGNDAVEAYFAELYEKEKPRLAETVATQAIHLSDPARARLLDKVETLIRKVVIPAYARLTTRFSIRERNDFYLLPESLHGAERLLWGAAGLGLGGFVVWAPFIPLWSKEWVLVFAVGGLVFPNLRRVLSLRRYATDLNGVVARADDEIWRMDMALLTSGATLGVPAETSVAAEAPETSGGDHLERLEGLGERDDEPSDRAAAAARDRLREGGR